MTHEEPIRVHYWHEANYFICGECQHYEPKWQDLEWFHEAARLEIKDVYFDHHKRDWWHAKCKVCYDDLQEWINAAKLEMDDSSDAPHIHYWSDFPTTYYCGQCGRNDNEWKNLWWEQEIPDPETKHVYFDDIEAKWWHAKCNRCHDLEKKQTA